MTHKDAALTMWQIRRFLLRDPSNVKVHVWLFYEREEKSIVGEDSTLFCITRSFRFGVNFMDRKSTSIMILEMGGVRLRPKASS